MRQGFSISIDVTRSVQKMLKKGMHYDLVLHDGRWARGDVRHLET
jgi:hypothetical protein